MNSQGLAEQKLTFGTGFGGMKTNLYSALSMSVFSTPDL